ncbi:MAG: NTPase KAP [Thalassospira sp.]|uniref:KAP family P-loop NTPase fold protein n=1 Tax=Thalassospira sp. TaxID=1912094 RepID=UPI000C62F519|nr:P-loop NTPase fold protein [Thalassospira sp.]MAZ31538.1 NTPase KAP [Thalassospira sp.]
MWADIETSTDFLNFGETAELSADLINNPSMLPLSIGIFGGWGAGKSSLLNLVERKIEDQDDVLIVRFDAWLYQGFDDARAALMEVIAIKLAESTATDQTLLDKVHRLSKRVNYLRLAGLVADAGLAAATGGIGFGVMTKSFEAGQRLLTGDGTDEDADTLKKAVKSTTKVFENSKQKEDEALRNSPQKQISAIREEYAEVLGALGKRLIVFIDNLDRCLPRNAIHTLEAVRLFLFLPKTAFIVAADEDMIRHAVKEHYSDPTDRHVSDYLDKLIQIPVRVPRLGVQEITAYLFMLFASSRGIADQDLEALRVFLEKTLQASWKNEPITSEAAFSALGDSPSEIKADFDLAARLAPILAAAPKVQGNPRIVKRLLNTIRMRSTLAVRRNMPLDETIIAKLALFERCTDDKTFAHLCSLINESRNGQPEIFEKLEALQEKPDELNKACPEPWKDHQEFLKSWLLLPPALSGIDLRAAVYLSREVAPLRVSKDGLSANATECFQTLMVTKTKASPAARQAIGAVDPSEHPQIMEALINEMRRTTDWQSRPAGIIGATALSDASVASQTKLKEFLDSVKVNPRPLWMQSLVSKIAEK